MPGTLFQFPKTIAWDNGSALGAATLTFSQTGTSTPQNVYTDEALSVAHADPVVADSEGVFAPIYLDPSLVDYRVVFKDSAGTTIYTVDDVPASIGATKSVTIEDTAPSIVIKESDATTNEQNWRIIATGDQLLFQTANDALDTFVTFLTIDRSTTTATLANLAATDVQVNGVSVVDSGTFNGTPTGGTGGSATAIAYRVYSDGMVSLHANAAAVTVTSTSTAFTITGVPAALRPTNQCLAATMVTDGAVTPTQYYSAMAIISTGGTMTFYMGSPLSATGFTNSNIKGWPLGASIRYPLT